MRFVNIPGIRSTPEMGLTCFKDIWAHIEPQLMGLKAHLELLGLLCSLWPILIAPLSMVSDRSPVTVNLYGEREGKSIVVLNLWHLRYIYPQFFPLFPPTTKQAQVAFL